MKKVVIVIILVFLSTSFPLWADSNQAFNFGDYSQAFNFGDYRQALNFGDYRQAFNFGDYRKADNILDDISAPNEQAPLVKKETKVIKGRLITRDHKAISR